jgi:hypothetical protein
MTVPKLNPIIDTTLLLVIFSLIRNIANKIPAISAYYKANLNYFLLVDINLRALTTFDLPVPFKAPPLKKVETAKEFHSRAKISALLK